METPETPETAEVREETAAAKETKKTPRARKPRKNAPRGAKRSDLSRAQIERILDKADRIGRADPHIRGILGASVSTDPDDTPGLVHAVLADTNGQPHAAVLADLFERDQFEAMAALWSDPSRIKHLWRVAAAAGIVEGDCPAAPADSTVALGRAIAARPDAAGNIRHAARLADRDN